MDTQIKQTIWQKYRKQPRLLLVALSLLALSWACWLLVRNPLNAAVPPVDRAHIVLDEVRRGPFLWQVEGTGVLTAARTLVLTAPVSAQIRQNMLEAGAPTVPGSAILQMSSSDNDAAIARLQGALKLAELELQVAIQDAQMAGYAQDIAVSRADSAVLKSSARMNRERKLADRGITSALTLDQLEIEHRLLEHELLVEQRSGHSRVALAQTREQSARAKVELLGEELRQAHVTQDALLLRAPGPGLVQKILHPPGTAVQAGTAVAEWADLSQMRAMVKVSEWEAGEVQVGQSAEVLLGGRPFAFEVARIDPAVVDGVIGVELAALDTLPPTARINASVAARILIKQLDDTLSITRPARLGRNADKVALYRVEQGSRQATRVEVSFGARSSSRAQILDGLEEGALVILSDLALADNASTIQLN